MCSMQLDTIKTAFLCQLNAVSEILFCWFNVLQSHSFRNIVGNVQSTMIVPDDYLRWGEGLKSPGCLMHAGPSSVEDLKEYFRVFSMDCLNYFLPSLCMLLSVETSSTRKALTALSPCCGFWKDHACASSLRVIVNKELIGDAILGIASLPGEGGHTDSVFELDLSHYDRIIPAHLSLMFHLMIYPDNFW